MDLWEPKPKSGIPMVPRSAKRLQKDISAMISSPPEDGIFGEPDIDDIRYMKVLIMGPKDTPYEGGMFLFLVEFTDEYPIMPPRVKLLTTGNGSVRFNPNLYDNGKVCLSLLGTFSGPGWSPIISLPSLMVAIQSLMNDKPYHNEPGFENRTRDRCVERYNEIIQHETIRIAAIDAYENKNTYPETMIAEVDKAFKINYDYYVEVCRQNIKKDGQKMDDPFGQRRGNFRYKSLLEKLESLKPLD